MLKYLISVMLMFIYLFAVNVTFLPSMISTRWFLAVPGAFLMFRYYREMSNRSVHYRHSMRRFWQSLVVFYVIVLLSGVINSHFDGVYSLYPITLILLFTSSFGLVCMLNKIWNGIDLRQVLWLFVLACIFHLALSIVMFFVPAVDDYIFSFIRQAALEEYANENTILNRFHTIGAVFFGAGVVYAYCLLILTMLLQRKGMSRWRWVLSILFIFILAVGSAVSRTTQIGAVVAVGYLTLTFCLTKEKGKFLKLVRYAFVGVIVIVLSLTLFSRYIETNMMLEGVANHAFEGIYNWVNEGKYYTSSSDKMFAAYMWPDNIGTWIIGDGRLKGIDEYSYYKFTDIGWCRLVFDFGIIGTIAYFLMSYRLLKVVFLHRIDYLCVFALFVAFHFKGIADLLVYFLPAAMVGLFREPQKMKFKTYENSRIS